MIQFAGAERQRLARNGPKRSSKFLPHLSQIQTPPDSAFIHRSKPNPLLTIKTSCNRSGVCVRRVYGQPRRGSS